MPLQKIQLRAGTNRENTNYANEGGWYATNKVRFRSGQPEKIGGWQKDTGTLSTTVAGTFTTIATPSTGTLWGVVRNMWNWLTLSAYNLLSLGSNLKYYIQNGTGGSFYDITPLRTTTAAGAVTFAATNNSSVLTVTNTSHGAQSGDFVTFSGAVSLGGNITAAILNAEFQIAYISTNTYSVTVPNSVVANTSDTGNGGGAVVGAYQINTGSSIFTYGVGWTAGGWGGVTTGVATTAVSGGTLSAANTTVTVSSTTGFTTSGTIIIDSELITYAAGGGGGTSFTGCTRGVSGTTATTHANATPVLQATTYTGWGSAAATGVGIQLRTWSQSNFGENLIFNYRGGPLYYWYTNATSTIFNRAVQLVPSTTVNGVAIDAYCPTVCNFVMVSDASRFIITMGVNDYGASIQDPMLIRWSDQESYATWYPSITNQAGSYRLSRGSTIITAIQTRQEILIWTDSALYSMQYVGTPYVWSFQILADNISIVGPNSVSVASNVVYWMGLDKFYKYDGRVQTNISTLREYVYNNINLTQAFQFISGTNEGYNEIWWHYCSVSGPSNSNTQSNPNTLIDSYVIYNYVDNVWYYGDWNNYAGSNQGRTAWLDSSLRAYPMAAIYGSAGASTNSVLVYHENGVDDGGYSSTTPVPIVSSVQSSDFDIADGDHFGFVHRIIPDVTFDGSNTDNTSSVYPTCYFTVIPKTFPGAPYGQSNNPAVTSTQNYVSQRTYNVQQFTEQVFVRIRGRQMAFKVSSGTTGSTTDGLGVQWQLGTPRIDIRPDGRR